MLLTDGQKKSAKYPALRTYISQLLNKADSGIQVKLEMKGRPRIPGTALTGQYNLNLDLGLRSAIFACHRGVAQSG